MVKIFKNSVLLCSMKRSIHPVQFSGNCPTETHVRHVARDRFLLLMFVFFLLLFMKRPDKLQST